MLHCIYHTLYSEIRPHYIYTHCEYNQLTLTLKNSQYKELHLVNRYHDRGLAFGKALEEYIGNCSFEHFAFELEVADRLKFRYVQNGNCPHFLHVK